MLLSLIFFVPKKNGSLRPCLDYRDVKQISKVEHYPLPLISILLYRPATCKWFTVLDLRGAYHLLRVREGDEWKTAFRCIYGQFEYLVVSFGLHGAPGAFQRFMNSVLVDLLDICCVCYLDDILIFSATLEQHKLDVAKVLQRLHENRLFVL